MRACNPIPPRYEDYGATTTFYNYLVTSKHLMACKSAKPSNTHHGRVKSVRPWYFLFCWTSSFRLMWLIFIRLVYFNDTVKDKIRSTKTWLQLYTSLQLNVFLQKIKIAKFATLCRFTGNRSKTAKRHEKKEKLLSRREYRLPTSHYRQHP